jgi:hypothetical protein
MIAAQRVFYVAEPDRLGKVIQAGEQQSEVRFDDGAVRFIPTAHLREVEMAPAADDGLRQRNPSPPVSDVVRLGQEAMARRRRGWEDWLAIAEALEAGRTEVMRSLNTNESHGRRYEKAMGDWLVANGFKEIDKGARTRALECLKHKVEIEKWRARLTDSERFKLNHPEAVLRKWKASTVVPDPNAPPKPPSSVQKLKDSVVALQEENDRMRREIEQGGGDLWSVDDRPKDIAKVIFDKLGKSKAKALVKEIQKLAGAS